jgi:hypothetical protein
MESKSWFPEIKPEIKSAAGIAYSVKAARIPTGCFLLKKK